MPKEKKSYCIVKELVLENGITQNVIIVDSGSEVIEFDNKEEASRLAEIFKKNSERGYKYIVKKI